jgi:cobalt-zinc-cadmium efflux system membrane fusion protein
MKRNLVGLTALVAVSLLTCNRPAPDEHDHGAGGHTHDGPEPLSYTVYGQRTEVFVEFKPLVVGSPSRFATHVTVLGEAFKPLTAGTVTVSLLVGERGIRHAAPAPSVPGIYRLALSPVAAGKGRLVFDVKTPAFTDQIVIDDVTVFADEKTALAAQPTEIGASNEITYLKEQAWKVDFATEPLHPQPLGEVIRTTGQILPAPGDEAVVSAPFDGLVQLTGTGLVPGRAVRAGERLVTLTSQSLPNANLDARLAQARTDFARAQTDYERAQELNRSQLITGQDFEAAKAQFENARTTLRSLEATYRPGGKTLTAPMAGYVREVLVRPGQYAAAGQPLLTLTRTRRLVVRADVPPQATGLLSHIQTATLRTPGTGQRFTLAELGGRVLSYARSTDPATGYTPLLLEVDNRGGLLPGTLVDVWLQTAPRADALTVPESALLEEQGTFFVYVQTGGESFEKREVQLGTRDGQRAQLRSGVQPGERIVTKGGYQIRLASLSGTLPAHGHEH